MYIVFNIVIILEFFINKRLTYPGVSIDEIQRKIMKNKEI